MDFSSLLWIFFFFLIVLAERVSLLRKSRGRDTVKGIRSIEQCCGHLLAAAQRRLVELSHLFLHHCDETSRHGHNESLLCSSAVCVVLESELVSTAHLSGMRSSG